jgi:hypothetical protein
VAVAVAAVAVEHFAARWQISPSLPDFASLLVDPDLSDLAAFAPVKVALLVEVVGFAMHFVAVAKPVAVVERLVAAAVPAVFAVLVVAAVKPVAVALGLGLFELHSDLHLLVAHWVYRCYPEHSL